MGEEGEWGSRTVEESGSESSSTSSSSAEVEASRRCGGLARRLLLVRHGERVDRVFPDWLRLAFRGTGDGAQYRPYDLNLPLALPGREALRDFRNDAPLTELGLASSQLLGRAVREAALSLPTLFVSPALRCLQTAQQMIKQMRGPVSVRVEPGLFEWLGWYEELPRFVPPRQLEGLRVDSAYAPLVSLQRLSELNRGGETLRDYEERTARVLRSVLSLSQGGPVGIVAHAPTLHLAARLLLPGPSAGTARPPLSSHDVNSLGLHYPYTSSLLFSRPDSPAASASSAPFGRPGPWRLHPRPLPALTYPHFTNRPNTALLSRL